MNENYLQMKKKILKICFIIFNITSLFLFCILMYKNLIFFFGDQLQYHIYNSDYFINYSSGFVKRGLDGDVLLSLTKIFNLPPLTILRIFYGFAFVALSGIIARIMMVLKIPFFYLFSAFFFLFPFVYFSIFHLSKDIEMLVIAFFIMQITVKTKKEWIRFSLFNILMIFGILIHEALFIFMFFPLFVSSVFYSGKGDFKKKIIYFIILISPSVLAFMLMSFLYNGQQNNIELIYNSWKPYQSSLHHIEFNTGLFDGNLRPINGLLKKWYNFAGLGVLVVANFLFITCGAYLYFKKHFFSILIISLFQIIPILLVCYIASDFGRWFFISNVLVLFFAFHIRNFSAVDFRLNFKKIEPNILNFYQNYSAIIILLLVVFGGMPYLGCDQYFLYSNPFYKLFLIYKG